VNTYFKCKVISSASSVVWMLCNNG